MAIRDTRYSQQDYLQFSGDNQLRRSLTVMKYYNQNTYSNLNRNFLDGVTARQVVGSYLKTGERVEGGPIIKGDRKRPNAWSFAAGKTNLMFGNSYQRNGSYGQPVQGSMISVIDGPLRGIIHWPPIASFDNRNTAYEIALSRLNEKVRGGLDLTVALAESSVTYKMIKSLASVQRYFKGIGPKRWANEFLQLRYGWQPLLQDVYNVSEELIRVNLGMMKFKSRAHVLLTPKGFLSNSNIDVSGLGHYTCHGVLTKYELNCFSACELSVVLAPPNNVQQLARWMSLNPLSIAWELTPYSFVADWFVGIGDYMRNLETSITYGSSFSSGYKSLLYAYNGASTLTGDTQGKPYDHSGENNYFTYSVTAKADAGFRWAEFNRTLLTSYPCPNRPIVNTNLSSVRLLSAAALLTQTLKLR